MANTQINESRKLNGKVEKEELAQKGLKGEGGDTGRPTGNPHLPINYKPFLSQRSRSTSDQDTTGGRVCGGVENLSPMGLFEDPPRPFTVTPTYTLLRAKIEVKVTRPQAHRGRPLLDQVQR